MLAERGAYVSKRARFKDSDAVARLATLSGVINKVRTHLADEPGANPEVAEAVYRAMIAGLDLTGVGRAFGTGLAGQLKAAIFCI